MFSTSGTRITLSAFIENFPSFFVTFRRKDWRNNLRYASLTVLRVDDEISTIINEYSDGDLGLKKRSEQGSGTSTVPSATPQ